MKIEIEFRDRKDLRARVLGLLGHEEALEMVGEFFRPAGYVVNVREIVMPEEESEGASA